MQQIFVTPKKLADHQIRRKAVISLTPLIDVVFILLVFFMLVSSFMDWRSLSLDSSAPDSRSVEREQQPFIVAIQGELLLLNDQEVTLARVVELAKSRHQSDQAVSLQPLGETSVQHLISVLDGLNRADIQPLNLIDDPKWQADAAEDGPNALP